MKLWKHSLFPGMYGFRFALIGLLGLASHGHAQLLHQNSSFSFTPNPSGAFSWTVDGQNQLARQSFFYRIGGGAESPLESITGSPTVTVSGDLRTMDVVYTGASFTVSLSYFLTGNTSGSGRSGINTTVSVVNNTASQLDFHLFQYSDFNLGGSTADQMVQFYKSLGKFNRAVQMDGTMALTNTFTSGFNPPSAVEAALFDQTLQSLTDGSATFLNGSTNAGPGNLTYTILWDVLLAASGQAGDTLTINETTSLQVPEPSVIALALSGIAGYLVVRRRRKTRP